MFLDVTFNVTIAFLQKLKSQKVTKSSQSYHTKESTVSTVFFYNIVHFQYSLHNQGLGRQNRKISLWPMTLESYGPLG